MKRVKLINSVKEFNLYYEDIIILNNNQQIFKLSKNLLESTFLTEAFLSLNIINNYIIDYGPKIFDLRKEECFIKLDKGFSPVLLLDNKSLLCKKIDYEKEKLDYFVFNISEDIFNSTSTFEGIPIDFINDRLICRKEQIFVYQLDSFLLLWQKDISELGSYQEGNDMIKGEINNVYTDNTAVYVLTGLSIIAFDLDTGTKLWHTKLDTYQSRGLLKDGYLYTTSNAYINKVEIASGSIVYQKKLSGVTIQDELQEMPIANLKWHKDYIWAIMDTSPNALLKIDPNTGLYAEVLDLGTLGIMRHCHDPKFYQNRMYLLDYDQTLHICEEEALT